MPPDTGHLAQVCKCWALIFSIVVGAWTALPPTARAQTADTGISGLADVIDADVLRFGQQRVILWAIDAPERPQRCYINGTFWGCHEAAKRHLQVLAGRGEVSCTYRGEPDRLGRQYGVCTSGGQDLNEEMVKTGFALAYEEQSDEYLPAMIDAITAGVGLWQVGVEFEEPWEFRRRETPGGLR
ncbi:MAG: succinoglycan biosynthesis protein [Maritimibacter sp.]|nr:succinoglycan biosynthesis protein [Maritimibacter sp.]|tara:strand:+ start:4085 stop:4636 length:552 start_codon:yes stop_codon:yes gene_type:complete